MERLEFEILFLGILFVIFSIYILVLYINYIFISGRLNKIESFEELEKDIKLSIVKKWVNCDGKLSSSEIINNILGEVDKRAKSITKMSGWPIHLISFLTFFLIFMQLIIQISRYYISNRFNYVFPSKFPLVEVLALFVLILWVITISSICYQKSVNEKLRIKLNEIKTGLSNNA